MKYPEDHPLHGMTDKWIANSAEERANDFISAPTFTGHRSLALAHEYKRLKAESEEARDEKWCNMVHECGNAMGMRLGDNASDLVEFARKLREERDALKVRIDNRQFIMEKAPVEWLARAIKLSGAPEGSDWAGLLVHVKNLKKEGENDWYRVLSECGLAMGMRLGDCTSNAPEFARKLRERAEAAELSDRVHRARIKTLEGEAGVLLQKKLDSDEVKWQAWVDGGVVPMAENATPPPIERIAAALEKIAND